MTTVRWFTVRWFTMRHCAPRRPSVARRGLALGLALAVIGLVAPPVSVSSASAHSASTAAGRGATRTPIEHFVFLLQENHTFDNYFGTRPGVDGIPADTCMGQRRGSKADCVRPFHVDDRGSLDLSHTPDAFATQLNGGRMDGFVEAQTAPNHDGRMTMAYYDDRDLPYYWNIADEYVLFDRFFSSSGSGSGRNHMYWVAGAPGNKEKTDSIPAAGWGSVPTIFDRLEAAGVSWKFYVQNYDSAITYRSRDKIANADRASQLIWVPLLNYARFLDNPRLFNKIVDMDQYYQDVASGQLPAVSFMVPGGSSEHPPGSVVAGQTMVRSLVNELMRSEAWRSSAFLWAYDDWGGWYDHVVPPQVDEFGYGFRVPALLVSPYAKRGYVCSTTLDFTSGLKFIEANWSVAPLAERDRKANNILDAFDFGQAPRPPMLIGTDRGVTPLARPNPIAIYIPYAAIVAAVALLVGVATRQSRRRPTNRIGEPT